MGTELCMRYKWSFIVLASLNKFRFCIQVFKGLFMEIIYIYKNNNFTEINCHNLSDPSLVITGHKVKCKNL